VCGGLSGALMLSHYLSLALRHIVRTQLYAAISVTGLAIGFAAAILIGLYVHDELTYERWFPSSERIYRVAPSPQTSGEAAAGPSDIGLWLANDAGAGRRDADGGYRRRADAHLGDGRDAAGRGVALRVATCTVARAPWGTDRTQSTPTLPRMRPPA
jgi:hypothetical protein